MESQRLRFRPFLASDAARLQELDGDPEVMRYVGHGLGSLEAYQQQIDQVFRPQETARTGLGFWAAEERVSGQFIGWFHLRPAEGFQYADIAGYAPGEVDLGFRLRRAIWGQGYATEGAGYLVEQGFAHRGITRVVACVMVSNQGSIRVLEKLGFHRESEFTLPVFQDRVVRYGRHRSIGSESRG